MKKSVKKKQIVETNSAEAMKNLWGKHIAADFSPGRTIKRNPTETLSEAARKVAERFSKSQPAISSPGLRLHRFLKEKEVQTEDTDFIQGEILGEGGMGIVYQARQISVDREIAIKSLKSEYAYETDACKRFLQEAMVTGELDHPGIIPIHFAGFTEEGKLFIAIKKVNGVGWLETIHQKSLKENLDLLIRVTEAVAFAHSKEIIHRDLKPENVMLGEFGEVFVMDWGLAASISQGKKARGVTEENAQAGTPAYMPPEVARCKLEFIGARSDIYMLGGILYEICTGLQPHSGEDIYSCLSAAAKNELQPTDKKGELIDIARKALETHPDSRFQTVGDFRIALQNFANHAESLALTQSAKEDLGRAGNDYSLLSRSLALFEESVKLWPDNVEGKIGIVNTRKIYASIALARGDLDLGKSLILPEEPEHRELNKIITKAIEDRKLRALRLKILTYGFLCFIIAIIIILIRTGFLLQLEHDKAIEISSQMKMERERAIKALLGSEELISKSKLQNDLLKEENKNAKEELEKLRNELAVRKEEMKKFIPEIQQQYKKGHFSPYKR